MILFKPLIVLENKLLYGNHGFTFLIFSDIINHNICLVYNSQFLDTLWSHFLSPFTLKYCVDRQKQKHTSYPLKTMSFELKYVVIVDDKRKIGTLVFYTYFILNYFLYRTIPRIYSKIFITIQPSLIFMIH